MVIFFFYKEPEKKYIKLCEPRGHILCHCSMDPNRQEHKLPTCVCPLPVQDEWGLSLARVHKSQFLSWSRDLVFFAWSPTSAQCLPDGVWLRNGERGLTILASGIRILMQWRGGKTANDHDVRRPMFHVSGEHWGRRSIRGQSTRQSK